MLLKMTRQRKRRGLPASPFRRNEMFIVREGLTAEAQERRFCSIASFRAIVQTPKPAAEPGRSQFPQNERNASCIAFTLGNPSADAAAEALPN